MPREQVAVIGLGYVGLPLAIALARHHAVVGYDVDGARVQQLKAGHDRTNEIEAETLRASTLRVTSAASDIGSAEIMIVTVPTPVDAACNPDLGAVRAASELVGRFLRKGVIVVYESTVYPGVTEEVCGPILERASHLVAGRDFFLGYSPERINPGDREHTIERITKVVAGQTPAVAARLAALYGSITSGGIHIAPTIKTAEAAKVIENAQRDVNIAFINEVTTIFHKLGISALDVLAAAGTKWNFLNFRPGLVGGHCIGVDPYYLAHRAIAAGHDPEVILAGRRINDRMGHFIATEIGGHLKRRGAGGGRVLVLGLTFKENVPDLRNSKVVDVIQSLAEHGYQVDVHDPLADPAAAKAHYGIALRPSLSGLGGYAAVVGAVAHKPYAEFRTETFAALVAPGGLVADIKGLWRGIALPAGMERWEL
ncbi:MAG: nucleotide sugar dehydrogenase [Alphaproteobacteria bacterium]|nr:nucleotide sugar dehydrogenase [Alphaproteobacteria bacterium]